MHLENVMKTTDFEAEEICSQSEASRGQKPFFFAFFSISSSRWSHFGHQIDCEERFWKKQKWQSGKIHGDNRFRNGKSLPTKLRLWARGKFGSKMCNGKYIYKTSRYGAFGPVFYVACARLESYSACCTGDTKILKIGLIQIRFASRQIFSFIEPRTLCLLPIAIKHKWCIRPDSFAPYRILR